MMTCQRNGCDDTATTAVEWLESELTYCERHAKVALQRFPDLARLADGEELRENAGDAVGGEA